MSTEWQPIVKDLARLVHDQGWEEMFQESITRAHKSGVPEMADIKTGDDYLYSINLLLSWVPSEDLPGTDIDIHLCKFYFVLDQPPIKTKQNPIVPSEFKRPLSWRHY
ncbi:hypothetical protein MMC15_007586 [Xylographa vitiligo]|nr:hypothetical protein [Xylographa vitiligo]